MGMGNGLHSFAVWLGAALLIFGVMTLKTGSELSSFARHDARTSLSLQSELDEKLILLEAGRQSPIRDLQHQLDVMDAQQRHELKMKKTDRRHQRKLLAQRQPHEIVLKGMELTLLLGQLVSIAKSEDKFEKYETIFNRLQVTTDRMTEDIKSRTIDDDEKMERIEAVRKDLAQFASKMQR